MVKKWKFIRVYEEIYTKLSSFEPNLSFSDKIEQLLTKKERFSTLSKEKTQKLARERTRPNCFGRFKSSSGLCQDCFNRDECRVITQ